MALQTMQDIRADFEANGVSSELDELDLLQIRSRQKKNAPSCEVDQEMLRSIDKVRRILEHMKPLNGKKYCVFCKTNKEQYSIYSTHVVKDENGHVTCPILYKYKCPMCGATGPNAHTIKYCKFNDGSSIDCVFKTSRNGAGRLRRL